MTEGNCAIMEYWGNRIHLRGLGVPYARLSGATASFSASEGLWWVVPERAEPDVRGFKAPVKRQCKS